jgi:hypothetical protein
MDCGFLGGYPFKTAQGHNPEDHKPQFHCRENLTYLSSCLQNPVANGPHLERLQYRVQFHTLFLWRQFQLFSNLSLDPTSRLVPCGFITKRIFIFLS